MKFDRSLNGFVDAYLGSPSINNRVGSASIRVDMADNSSDDFSDEFDSVPETDDGRLSRSLQSWMTDHSWTTVEPMERPPREPLFSGKLGKERKMNNKTRSGAINARTKNNCNSYSSAPQRPKTAPIRRIPSEESIVTKISLLTCSDLGTTQPPEEEVSKGKRRRRRKMLSRASTATSRTTQPVVSKWLELGAKKSGELRKIFRNQAGMNMVGIIAGEDLHDESEAFRMFDKDEQEAVFKCGYTHGLKYVNKAKCIRSLSVTDADKEEIQRTIKNKQSIKRVLSANATKSWGPPLDVVQFKRDRLNKLIAAEQAKQQQEKEKLRRARRFLLNKNVGQRSLTNMMPSKKQMASSTTSATPSVIAASTNIQSLHSEHSSSEIPTDSISDNRSNVDDNEEEDAKVAIWKNDREILEIDLNRGLTERVKERIDSTRSALKLATGYGEDNRQRPVVGAHEEFPNHVEDDFSHKPRIVQKIRISPQLSSIIHHDIQVRMGRPRYHEIRIHDLELWDEGQSLNHAHRNLKVFNWLHSLRDVTFVTNVAPEIDDDPPADDSVDLELLHVESADEPDVKPLFCQFEVRIL